MAEGLTAEVVAVLNERAADAAARRLETRFAAAGKVSADQFDKAFQAEVSRSNLGSDAVGQALQSRIARHGTQSAAGFGSAFGSQLAQSLPGVSGFASAMSGYEGVAQKAGAATGRAFGLALTTAAVGIIGAAGYTLFKGFERYEAIDAARNRLENLNRTLAQTGRATIDVAAVMETVGGVVEDTRFSLDQAFSISARALSSPTGDLQRFMTAVADTAQFTGENLDSVGEAFLKIANKGKVSMEELGNELRGIPQDWLARHFQVSGAELSKLISDGKVGFEDLLQTVEANVSGFAKGSVDTIEGAREQLSTAISRLGANVLGVAFGKPTEEANNLKDAINAITARLNDVNTWVTANGDKIRNAFEDAVRVAGELASAIGDVMEFLGRMGIGIDDVVRAFVAWKAISGVISLTDKLGGINTMLAKDIPASANKASDGITAALARVVVPTWLTALLGNEIANRIQPPPEGEERGPGWAPSRGFTAPVRIWEMLTGQRDPNTGEPVDGGSSGPPPPAGQPRRVLINGEWVTIGRTGSGKVPPGTLDGPAGAQRERRGGVTSGAPGGPGPAGNPILDPSGAGDSSGPRLPPAPVVPYADLPAIDPRLQMTASLFSAQTAVADARTNAAEKEARLNQLLATNAATADEIQSARNDVAKTEREALEAEMRFTEAQQSAFEQQYKQLEKATNAMADFGAGLDSDFGISDGLAGLADNLVRLAGAVALAGPMAMLNNISNVNPDQGSGMLGMLASTGAFGVEYTPAYRAMLEQQGTYSPSALGPAGLQPGMAGLGAPTTLRDTGSVPSGPQSRTAAALVEQYFGDKLRGTIGGSRDTGTAKKTHDLGLSIDIPIGPDQMELGDQITAFLQQNADALGLEYTIWRDKGVYPGTGGKTAFNSPGHFNHIDAHFNGNPTTAALTGGPSFDGFGTPGSPQAIANMIYQQATARGYSAHEAQSIVAYAIGESSLNPGISGGPQGGPGSSNEVVGLFQQKPAFAAANGIDPSQRADPSANTYAYLNALDKTRSANPGMSIEQLLPKTSVGGPLAHGAGAAPQPWAPLMNQAAGYLGGPGQLPTSIVGGRGESPIFGAPMAPPGIPGMPGIGSGAGVTTPGMYPGIGNAAGMGAGQPYPAMGGDGGLGVTGMAMDAAMMGTSALDVMMPGAGAAAKVGIQLANLTIKQAGKIAGIGVSGVMETLSVGDNPMGSIGSSWFGKLAGGLAGAKPALPNKAGGAPPGMDPSKQPGGPGGSLAQQAGQKAGNTANINITNNGATPDQNGKDVAAHTAAMWAPAGRQ